MKKITLLIVSLLCVSLIAAQSGNTINDAIAIDGTGVTINVLNFDSATQSGLLPSCGVTEDVFYRHDVSPSDNKITIGMVSAGVSLLTSVDYQILLAPNGDINSLELITCSTYAVPLIGGSFELIIDNVEDTDVYYLRVYKTSGLGGVLTDLLNGTSITMVSEFDSSLSINDLDRDNFKIVVKNEKIKLYESDYNKYKIFSLDGKQITSNVYNQAINFIDISRFNKGLFILLLSNNRSTKAYKFVKK